MAVTWSTRWRWDSALSADSVEWCPIDGYRQVLVCGTYQLDQQDTTQDKENKKQSRLGKIYLFFIDENTETVSPIQTVDTSGVLDQKWCYHTIKNHPILAVVTSDGFIEMYRLVDNGKFKLDLWLKEKVGEDLLGLSVDWSTNKYHSEAPKLIVSDSSGSVNLFAVGNDGLKNVGTWKSHGFEAWIGAFNYWNTDVFYSGGDDCLFKTYDARIPEIAQTTNKTHEAGVTSVRSHVDIEHQLLTGSYDEKVRVWDTRNMKGCIKDKDVGGGIWRLKYHPHRPDTVLAACMYGGFRILSADGCDVKVLCDYLEHTSIAYGADWQHEQNNLVATCSFYDCKMHVSNISFN